QQQERYRPAAARRSFRNVGQLVADVVPVRKSGQPIETRKIVDLALRALSLDGIADRAQDDAAIALPLHEIVLHAAVQDFDREVLVALAAQHEDWEQGIGLPHPPRRA